MWAIGSRAVDARMRRWERSVRRNGSAGRLTDLALLVFMLWMLAEMEIEAGEETIPYHLLFLSLTIVYGFRVWPLAPTAVVILGVTVSTGLIMYIHYQRDLIDGPELAEIPLMPALVVAMVWHARRRASAQDALQEMADRQGAMLDRERNFFRQTSHAIRTPVTIARGHLELIEPAIASPQVREDVQVAMRQLDRMSVLSHRLLALAQLDAGEVLPAERIRLSCFVHELGRNWSVGAPRDWSVVCSGDGVVLADPAWLGLAVDALVENAVHFTSEGGRIEIAGVCGPDGCTIRVSDDGPGIAETDLPHVFERFWHRLPPEGPMGSGLGLAMARATARAWGGDVTAGDGRAGGAVFELRLPRLTVGLTAPSLT